jgi:hypothetical protein
MCKRTVMLGATVAAALLLPGSARGDEPSPRPATRAVAPREYRFDALRIDGTPRGPEALVIRAVLGRDDGRPLHRRARSFVHRIFETIEAPCLHGR